MSWLQCTFSFPVTGHTHPDGEPIIKPGNGDRIGILIELCAAIAIVAICNLHMSYVFSIFCTTLLNQKSGGISTVFKQANFILKITSPCGIIAEGANY